MSADLTTPRPYTLVAELTYACPLRCGYCSNPRDLGRYRALLGPAEWCEVVRQAEALGVVQVNVSGGEPLLYAGLERVVRAGAELDLNVNLITSGVPLARERLVRLRDAGLSAIQISFQDVNAGAARRVAGVDHLEQKMRAAHWAVELGLPLTVNVVLHGDNIKRTPEFVALAETLGADRLELANTQYLNWALHNREALLPSAEALERARQEAELARRRLRGRMEVLFVMPDYFRGRPRACMSGWARRYLVIAPNGEVMPCHAAASIPELSFENVRQRSLSAIWRGSSAFAAFRDEGWMPEPCRSCSERTRDFGGCRCQAFALTGDARATDPACNRSPHHAALRRHIRAARSSERPLVELRRAR